MTEDTSWGILGNLTPEKIKKIKDMPHGEFKKLLKNYKTKNAYRKHIVQVTPIYSKVVEDYESSFEVEAETSAAQWAINEVKYQTEKNKELFEIPEQFKDYQLSFKYKYVGVTI